MKTSQNQPPDEIQISVVSPVYAASKTIPVLCEQLHAVLQQLAQRYEIVLVFDCSPDDGWERICVEVERDSRVRGIKLSRNFGQHQAITAGLEHSRGKWVVVMDCDLQDQPTEITRFFEKAQEGFDVVVGKRVTRRDRLLKRMSSRLFHLVFAILSGINTDASVANFGIYHRKVISQVLAMSEPSRSFPMLVLWLGFERCEIPVGHASRYEGNTSYTFSKLIAFALSVIVSFSNRPLYFAAAGGAVIAACAAVVGAVYLVIALAGNFAVAGWASLILSIWFLSGAIICIAGIVGIYVAKSFDAVKRRPLYVVDRFAPDGDAQRRVR